MNPAPLHLDVYGSGTPVILAHGFGGSARNFGPQVRALRQRFRVGVFDARGHARSPAEDDPRLYTIPAFVEDWRAVMGTVGPEPGVVGGLSLGAATAARFALAYPECVRALVLASFPLGDAESLVWASRFAAELDRRALGEALVAVASSPGSPINGAELGLVARGFTEHSGNALRSVLRGALATPTPAQEVARALSKLSVPILVLAGARDARAMLSATAFEQHCPRAEIVRIPGAGHVVNMAAPEAFNDSLLSFLERHELGT